MQRATIPCDIGLRTSWKVHSHGMVAALVCPQPAEGRLSNDPVWPPVRPLPYLMPAYMLPTHSGGQVSESFSDEESLGDQVQQSRSFDGLSVLTGVAAFHNTWGAAAGRVACTSGGCTRRRLCDNILSF